MQNNVCSIKQHTIAVTVIIFQLNNLTFLGFLGFHTFHAFSGAWLVAHLCMVYSSRSLTSVRAQVRENKDGRKRNPQSYISESTHGIE